MFEIICVAITKVKLGNSNLYSTFDSEVSVSEGQEYLLGL